MNQKFRHIRLQTCIKILLRFPKHFIFKGSANKKKYVRQVGLGFKVPREAREGAYVDKKCPFTGDVLIR